MILSGIKFVLCILIALLLIPLEISGSLAVNYISTENFFSELKSKIKDNYKVGFEDIVIDCKEDDLGKKILEIRNFYPNKDVNIGVNDAIIGDISGKNGIPVEVFVDGKLNRILYLRCKVEVLKEVLVAGVKLKKGDVISDEQLKYSRVPVNKIQRNSELVSIENAIGKELTRDILENTVITSNLLKEKTVIFRGNQVTIKLINGELTLLGVGLALQDGYVGQNIRVKVVGWATQKVVTGRVISADLIEINLGSKN